MRSIILCLLMSLAFVHADYAIISHKRSITVKQSIDKTSASIGMAYSGESYWIIKKKVGYYRILLSSGKEGWVQGKSSYRRFIEDGDKLIIEDDLVTAYETLSVKSKSIGLARQGEALDILERVYTHYKIKLNDGSEGWVYAGKPDDPWIHVLEEDRRTFDEKHIIADFSNSVIESTFLDMDYHRMNFLNSQSSHQLFKAHESVVTLNFELTDVVPKYLELTHAVKMGDPSQDEIITTISIFLNENPVVEKFRVMRRSFFPDYLYIEHHLNEGENVLRIQLNEMEAPYLIKRVKIFDANLMEDLKRISVQ